MASNPADPRGLVLRGIIARGGFERWLIREVLGVLEPAFKEIVTQLLTSDLSLRDRARLRALFADISAQLGQAYGDAEQTTLTHLADYAKLEADAALHDLGALAGGDVQLSSAFLSSWTAVSIAHFPIQGLSIGEWWDTQAATMTAATRRAIQNGLAQGEGPRDIAATIIPARDASDPAVWRAARAQAMTLTRTSTTAVHADAAIRSYEALGKKVSGEYELVTARDNRVSAICRPLDGLRFRYDDPKRKMPPFHPNCRTTVVPVIDYKGLGMTPPPGVKVGGLSWPSFDDWLSGQSTSEQNTLLGPTRADLWRGGMPLSETVDGDGRVFTLDQLRTRLGLT